MFKKRLYDGLGMTNAAVSRVYYDLSRFCKSVGKPRMAIAFFNKGNDHSTRMMKYWIKSMNCEELMDVKVVTN